MTRFRSESPLDNSTLQAHPEPIGSFNMLLHENMPSPPITRTLAKYRIAVEEVPNHSRDFASTTVKSRRFSDSTHNRGCVWEFNTHSLLNYRLIANLVQCISRDKTFYRAGLLLRISSDSAAQLT